MKSKVKPIPDGYSSAFPYLIIRGAGAAIEFYKKALGAKEVMRYAQPDGKVGHAEMKIGDAMFMLADEYPDMGHLGPQTLGGSPVSIMVYVENVDAVAKRAETVGAIVRRPVADQFYGDRSCTIEDPFGHVWHLATRKEELTEAEMRERAAAAREEQTA